MVALLLQTRRQPDRRRGRARQFQRDRHRRCAAEVPDADGDRRPNLYGQVFWTAKEAPYRFRVFVKPSDRATEIEFAISAWSLHREKRLSVGRERP